jgi:peptidoglycan/LPS O-acetylase OafA/YrhL
MISGFYMAMVLNQKYRPGQYALFLSQRYLRLWPTYAVIALLSLAGEFLVRQTGGNGSGALGAWMEHGSILDFPSRLVLIVTNLAIVGQDWMIFHAVNPQSGAMYWTNYWSRESIPALSFLVIGQAWSLAGAAAVPSSGRVVAAQPRRPLRRVCPRLAGRSVE